MAVSKVLLEQDRFNKLVRTSNSIVTLGSQTVNTATSGVGGLDTGSVAASTMYYVYTVVSGGAVRLIASTSAGVPSGFTSYRKVGAFYTDASFNIFKAYYYGEALISIYSIYATSAGVVSGESQDIINGNAVMNGTNAATFNFTPNTGIFSVIPNCVPQISDSAASSANFACQYLRTASTLTNLVFYTAANSTQQPRDISVVISKTGIDAVQPDWSR